MVMRMPERLDRVLRLIVITPDVHRVHHSATPRETDSNFGFHLPWVGPPVRYLPRPPGGGMMR